MEFCWVNVRQMGYSVRLLSDWHVRVNPEYDEGLNPVQVNALQRHGVGNGSRLFFNPTLGQDRLHGSLND